MVLTNAEKIPKILWVDDEPKTVKDTIKKLKETNNVDVKLIESPSQARRYLDEWEHNYLPFHVAILDLKFDQGTGRTGNGLHLASYINGKFSDAFKVSPRLGTVTAHMDDYQEELAKVKPFVFQYDKVQIDDGFFPQFARDVMRHSQLLRIDLAAMQYMDEHPLDIDMERFIPEKLFFGYVVDIQNDAGHLRLWDPRKIQPEIQMAIGIADLKERNIRTIGQAVRLCTFKDKKIRGADYILLEPIGKPNMRKWRSLRPGFDYHRFSRG